jgi:hypothetical protein
MDRRPEKISDEGGRSETRLQCCFDFFLAGHGTAQSVTTAYSSMAPLPGYLMPTSAFWRSAMRRSLSHGVRPQNQSRVMPNSHSDEKRFSDCRDRYERFRLHGRAVLVCGFQRSRFWDPKLRAPIYYSALAARSQVPATIKRTQVALAGGSKTHILKAVKVAVESGELSAAESGSMAYICPQERI